MIPIEQWIKIGKGALIAVAGAAITALASFVSDTDFGQLTGLVVAISSILVNVLRKWLTTVGVQ